jgi:exodeoxyribonuclease VII large subunit
MRYPLEWPIDVLTVSQLTSRVRDCISRSFRDVIVEGEVSNFKVYPSGHLYFTLKDDASSIKAVMFNYQGKCRSDLIKDGTAVICKGRIDVYEKRGEYRLIADQIEVRGLGLLQIKFELLKEKLFKEGLFEAARKRPLPFLPRRVGIVTSPAGAAITDMLKIIYGKFENMAVRIYPVRVQGDQACQEVVAGIEHFNSEGDVDVIILGRGGGSLEDLACFNEEAVARAICASRIPIVSGVGHEIDFTIADFVADVRAPTPTAAADMVVRDKGELADMLAGVRERLVGLMLKRLEGARLVLARDASALKEQRTLLIRHKMYLDELSNNLQNAFSTLFGERRVRLQACSQRLMDLNPDNILKRGYSITTRADTSAVVREAAQVAAGEQVRVRLFRGGLDCKVEKTRPE